MRTDIPVTKNKNVYTFSHSKVEIFLGNYLIALIIIIWFILLIWETFWGLKTDFSAFNPRIPLVSLGWLLPSFFVLGLFFYLFSSKFTYRTIFNLKEGKVIFYLYQKKKPVIFEIQDLKMVKITWHIYFVFRNGKTVWYKGDNELFRFLKEKNIPRKWGKISKILLKNEYEADACNL